MGLVSLVFAYAFGQFLKKESTFEIISKHYSDITLSSVDWSCDTFQLTPLQNNSLLGYLVTKTTSGWGGPLFLGTEFNMEGEIQRVIVLSHKETPSFFRSLERERYFSQFVGQKAADAFKIEKEVNSVSGATISSKAFANAVSMGAYDIGNNLFHLKLPRRSSPWQVGANEFILILFYGVVIVSTLRQYFKFRKILLVFSIGFLGFHIGGPIAISNIGSIFLGYFPPIETQMFWWLLVMGTLLLILVWGRNLYCVWMCPFGAIQELMTTIAGVRFRVPRVVIKIAEHLILFLLWLSLMIMFLTTTPTLGMFEPFATLFSLKGSGLQWYLVSISIFASFLIPKFWCRFFCPVGAFLKYVINLRKRSVNVFKRGANEKLSE